MNTRALFLVPALTLVAIAGCNRDDHGLTVAPDAHDAHAGHGHAEARASDGDEQGHAGEERHAGAAAGVHGHGHGHGHEGSDLDRPVAELFADRCEHDIATYECDECRYEVGVVRAAGNLLEAGLVRTEVAGHHRPSAPVRLTGEVQFDERRVAHLRTAAEGIIRKVLVNLGDRVQAGQALVEIESVAVGEAEAAYLEAEGALRLARKSFERVESLHREQIAAEKELLAARQALEAAEIRAEAARGTLVRLGVARGDVAALSRGNARGRLVLRAPSGGTILEMHAVSGELARSDEPLLTIGDTASVWVWADLYERDMALLRAGRPQQELPASVRVKAYPEESFAGTVDFVSPAMHEDSRTAKLRVTVPNPEQKLLAGMFATVEVLVPQGTEVLALPRVAVLEDEGRAFVFLHHHADYYVRRPVETGRTFGDRVEVREGLEGGEVVVTDGSFLMKSDVLRSKMGAGCAD